jgi:hypothetical protein
MKMSTIETSKIIDDVRQRFTALANQLSMAPQVREPVQAIGLDLQMVLSNLLTRIEMLEKQVNKQK